MRCFISTPISKEIRDKLKRIQEKLKESRTRMKLVEPKNMHNTLKFLGDINGKQKKKAIKALESIEANSFELEVNRFGAFPNQDYIKVLWAGVGKGEKEMKDIRQKLDEKLPGFEEKHEYTPHITIARVKSKPDKTITNLFNERISKQMQVKKIRLMKSKLKKTGPGYTEVHAIELD